jgi:aminoglycoside phosphotransferase (APT) family kinase protein
VIEDQPLAASIAVFVGEAVGRSVDVTALTRISGGMSREAWSCDLSIASTDGTTESVPSVMLRSAPSGLLDTSREREFRILRSLEAHDCRAPTVLWLDATGDALERPAFFMVRAQGSSNRRLLTGRPELADHVDEDFLRTMVALHQVPVDVIDIDDPTPSRHDAMQIQLDHWFGTSPDAASFPGAADVMTWLSDTEPRTARVALVHGDLRYGNFLFDDTGITTILDWEMAHLGDPVEDLVWSFRPFRRGTEPLLPLGEFVRRYEELCAWEIDPANLAYHRIFAELKTAMIYVTGVQGRLRGAGSLSQLVPAQLIACSLRQALHWIDELEG